MKKMLALLRVNFTSLLLTSVQIGSNKNKSKSRTGAGSLAFLCILFLFLSVSYSSSMGAALAPLGALDIMLASMLLMAVGFTLIFTLFMGGSLVFNTKDVDLVFSLPVSSFQVMVSRVLALYLEALLMIQLFILPSGIIYLILGGSGGLLFLLLFFFQGFFLALLPTTISILFGAIVALVSSFTKRKNLFNVLFSVLLVVGIMVASFSFSFGADTLLEDISGMRAVMASFGPLWWAVEGALAPNLLMVLGVIACGIVPFFAVTWLFSRFYKSMLSRLASHHLKNDYKLRDVKSSGAFSALLKKEAKRFVGTPIFLLNCGMGILLIVLASVAAAIFRGSIQELMAALLPELTALGLGVASLQYIICLVILGVVIFFASLTFTASVSISLEGKTLWILKESPLGVSRIFGAKAGFNFLLIAGTCLISVPLLAFGFSLTLLQAALILLVCLLFGGFVSTFGLFANLLLPRMDWESETVVVKQSASGFIAMLGGIVVIGLGVGLFFLLGGMSSSFTLYGIALAALLAIMNAVSLLLLRTKGKKLFDEL